MDTWRIHCERQNLDSWSKVYVGVAVEGDGAEEEGEDDDAPAFAY